MHNKLIFSPMALFNMAVIIVSILVLTVWGFLSGFSFDLSSIYSLTITLSLFFIIAFIYALYIKNGSVPAGFIWFGLFFSFSTLAAMSSYLSAALSFPLVDGALVYWDQILGFNWVGYVTFIAQYPTLVEASNFLYNISAFALIYVMVFLLIAKQIKTLEVLVTTLAFVAILASAISGLLPSVGPFFHMSIVTSDFSALPTVLKAGPSQYYDTVINLRSGALTNLSWADTKGIINFPSFHTVFSILMILAMRGFGVLFTITVVLNIFILLTIPFSGGHYLVDMIAGTVLTLISWEAALSLQSYFEDMQYHSNDVDFYAGHPA